jgi:hypothetical protein
VNEIISVCVCVCGSYRTRAAQVELGIPGCCKEEEKQDISGAFVRAWLDVSHGHVRVFCASMCVYIVHGSAIIDIVLRAWTREKYRHEDISYVLSERTHAGRRHVSAVSLLRLMLWCDAKWCRAAPFAFPITTNQSHHTQARNIVVHTDSIEEKTSWQEWRDSLPWKNIVHVRLISDQKPCCMCDFLPAPKVPYLPTNVSATAP